MNNGGEKDKLVLGAYSDAQLQTLKANAEKLLVHPEKPRRGGDPENVLRQVIQEIFLRQSRSANTVGTNCAFTWDKQGSTYTLTYRGDPVAIIRTVANHSLTNRDVYSAKLFGKPYPRMFEYIKNAKAEMLEKVMQRLAQEST
jgi:hypothetical protein